MKQFIKNNKKNILIVTLTTLIVVPVLVVFAFLALSVSEANKIKQSKTKIPSLIVETTRIDDRELVMSLVPDLFLLPTDTKEFEIEHKLQLKSNILKDKLNQFFIKITQRFNIVGDKLSDSSKGLISKTFVNGIEYNDTKRPNFVFEPNTPFQNFLIKVSANNEFDASEINLTTTYEVVDSQGKSIGEGKRIEKTITNINK